MAKAKKSSKLNDAYNMPFPTRLRDLLSTPGETQGKLADAIGVQRQSIGQWKDGITSPDINAFNKIANYYNVSADYLLGRTTEKSPDIDVQSIHEKTGLSEEAINTLITLNGIYLYESGHASINALSKLLENEDFWLLLSDISWLEIDYINKLLYEEETTRLKLPQRNPAHHPVQKIKERIEGRTLTLDASDFYVLEETEIKENFIGILRSIIQSSIEGKDLKGLKESFVSAYEEFAKGRNNHG